MSRGNRSSSYTVPSQSYLATIPEEAQFEDPSNGGSYSRIQVVIRVRPLTPKEVTNGHKVIVQQTSHEGHELALWDPACLELSPSVESGILDPSCWAKQFHFNKVLWSVDRKSSRYASQNIVFEELGQPVINWVVDGFNSCVLAYGQTGGGKTYTMSNVTNQNDPSEYGLIPRICFGLFETLLVTDAPSSINKDVTVTFSHIEIYNDNVRDLLIPPTPYSGPGSSGNGFLKVREHPLKGVFVAGLTEVRVTSFEEVMSLVAIGDKNRTVASTHSNAHSSRSHAIVNLTITQRQRHQPRNGLPTSALSQKTSKVYLVDLAGSERVTFSGAKGDRLREANHINVSLSVLGDVIKSLGDSSKQRSNNSGASSIEQKRRNSHSISSNSNNGSFVPYRNSTLTMILKDALGGNSHVIMLCAISPSSYDYEETLSTLKYADRAKRVRLQVKANVTSGLQASDSSALALVPLLQAEVRKLREMLRLQQLETQKQQAEAALVYVPLPRNDSHTNTSNSTRINHQYLNTSASSRESTISPSHTLQPLSKAEMQSLGQAQTQFTSHSQPTLSPTNPNGNKESEGDSASTQRVLREMRERVKELEEQLAEREKLIASLASLEMETTESAHVRMQHNHTFEGQLSQHSHHSQHTQNSINMLDTVSHPLPHENESQHQYDRYSFESVKTNKFNDSISDEKNNNHKQQQLQLSSAQVSSSQSLSESPLQSQPRSIVKLRRPLGGILGSGDELDGSPTNRNSGYSSSQPSATAASPVDNASPLVMLAEDASDIGLPRVINLNQDPLFSEVLVYYVTAGHVIAGSRSAHADILLSGPDITERHCLLRHIDGKVWLRPFPDALVFVNGEVVSAPPFRSGSSSTANGRKTGGTRNTLNTTASEDWMNDEDLRQHGRLLVHFDRIAFGRFHLFRFEESGRPLISRYTSATIGNTNISSTAASASQPTIYGDQGPGWDFAQQELLQKSGAMMGAPSRSLQELAQNGQNLSHGHIEVAANTSVDSNYSSGANNAQGRSQGLSLKSPSADAIKRLAIASGISLSEIETISPRLSESRSGSRDPSPSPSISSSLKDLPSYGNGDSAGRRHPQNQPSTSRPSKSTENSVPSASANARMNESNTQPTAVAYLPKSNSNVSLNLQNVGGVDDITMDYIVNETGQIETNNNTYTTAMMAGSDAHEAFEREAKALQQELALMQKTLADRMQKYHKLTAATPLSLESPAISSTTRDSKNS